VPRRLALIGVIAIIASGCGGSSASVEISLAQRVDVSATEDAYAGAGGVAVNGGTVWATKPNEGELIRIDAASGEILGRRHVCNGANDVAVGAGAVFVACEGDEEVLRLDRSGSVSGRAKVGVKALGLAVTDNAVWVSNREFDDLVRVDPTTMKVVARIDTGRGAWDVAASSNAVWVTTQSLEVVRVDPRRNEVVSRIPTVTDEISLSLGWVAADDENVWLTDPPRGQLVRLDPGSGEFTDALDLGEQFLPAHVQTVGGRVWVAGGKEVALVDADARSVAGELEVAVAESQEHGGLRGLSATEGGIWVVDPGDGEVVEISALGEGG
jgi:streptogramin lyase